MGAVRMQKDENAPRLCMGCARLPMARIVVSAVVCQLGRHGDAPVDGMVLTSTCEAHYTQEGDPGCNHELVVHVTSSTT